MSLFLDTLKDRIIVFDGAMGTNLQVQNLTLDDFGGLRFEGCNENLLVTRPDAVEKVHAGFLEVGCDVVETNSFNGTPVDFAEYDIEDKAYDMYAVSTVLFRNTRWRKQLFFPVRGRFFYQSPLGLFVNLVMGWFSMYPAFFATGDHPIAEKRIFDKFSFRLLTDLARTGAGNVIGFHPEGTRNKSDDPYSFLRAQPGVGKLIMVCRTQRAKR